MKAIEVIFQSDLFLNFCKTTWKPDKNPQFIDKVRSLLSAGQFTATNSRPIRAQSIGQRASKRVIWARAFSTPKKTAFCAITNQTQPIIYIDFEARIVDFWPLWGSQETPKSAYKKWPKWNIFIFIQRAIIRMLLIPAFIFFTVLENKNTIKFIWLFLRSDLD